MDYSVITCDEIIDAKEAKTIPKNVTCKTQNLYILLAFLSISIGLLIAVLSTTYCYLIKYRAKCKLHVTNSKLREVLY